MQINASKQEIVDMTLYVAKSPNDEMEKALKDIKLWMEECIAPLDEKIAD